MGFFSQDCYHCGHPLLSVFATDADGGNLWMTEGVSISVSGEIHTGTYDGYGRLGSAEDVVGLDGNTVFHRACWEELGRPLEYQGESSHSDDQGWFFDDGAHSYGTPSEAKAHKNPSAPWKTAILNRPDNE